MNDCSVIGTVLDARSTAKTDKAKKTATYQETDARTSGHEGC